MNSKVVVFVSETKLSSHLVNSHLHHSLVVVFERPLGFNILVQALLKSSQRSSQKKKSRTKASSSETLSGQDSELTNEVILLRMFVI